MIHRLSDMNLPRFPLLSEDEMMMLLKKAQAVPKAKLLEIMKRTIQESYGLTPSIFSRL
jgi:hypothetical protein